MAMTENDARQAMVADWMARQPQERQTEHQAAVFAMKAMQRYPLRGDRDRYRTIMRWLKPHVPQWAG
jgi:hypothetical protein